MLTANQKYIDTANIKHLLGAGEKNADKIQIAVDRYYHQTDLSDCLFTLRAVNSGGGLVMQNLEKEVTESQIILTWTITEDFTAVSMSANDLTGMVRMLEYVPFQAFFLKKLTSRAFIFPVPPILPRRPPDGAERYGSTVPHTRPPRPWNHCPAVCSTWLVLRR